MPVIDASVYVAVANQADRHHGRSLTWLESTLREKGALAAPSLLVIEVAASIRRLTGSLDVAERVVSDLQKATAVELYPLTLARSDLAARLASLTGVRGADAVYLALAKELGEPLVTLDRQQLERGREIVEVKKPA